MYQIVTVEIGHPRYEELLGPLRDDDQLSRSMWWDAESRLDETPGKRWVIAVVDDMGRSVAAAWAAAVTVDGQLKCCNNYERREYRGRGLYAAAYEHRHRIIVEPSELPCVTYIFREPLQLHLDDEWRVTGEGDSVVPDAPPHHWYELRRGVETPAALHREAVRRPEPAIGAPAARTRSAPPVRLLEVVVVRVFRVVGVGGVLRPVVEAAGRG
jgi:hypothetical protein